MVKRIAVSCPVCGSETYRVRYSPRVKADSPMMLYGAASGIPGTQQIVDCTHCRMMYENPRFSEEVILAAYAASEESGHDTQYPMRVQSFSRALKQMRAILPEAGRLLDVGCAGGALLEAAASLGYQAVGIEPSTQLAASGRQRGLTIYTGTVASLPVLPSPYQIITLFDVIEHVADPKLLLSLLKTQLSAEGRLIVNFPDAGTRQARIAGRRFWWFLSSHLHYFTRATMRKLLEESGFRVLDTQRYWQTLQLGYLFDIAHHMKIPGARLGRKLLPRVLSRLPISYYASQTTMIVEKQA